MTNPIELLGTIAEGIDDLLEGLFGPASVDSVFSSTTEDDGATVITAAAWERVGGVGFGGGGGTDATGNDGGGGGGGGGGVAQGRPVAVIRIADGDIRLVPVVDSTKIAVTFLVAAAAVWKALR